MVGFLLFNAPVMKIRTMVPQKQNKRNQLPSQQILASDSVDPQMKELLGLKLAKSIHSSFPSSGFHIYLHICLVSNEVKNRGLREKKNEQLQDRTWKGAWNQHKIVP